MKRHILPALALCAGMLFNTLPVSAAYASADEIAFAVRSQDGRAGNNTVRISPRAAQRGYQLHNSIYLEAERAELTIIGMKLKADTDALTFVPDSLIPANLEVYKDAVNRTTPDGIAFTTNYKPYCLGEISSNGTYRPNCFMFTVNPNADDPVSSDGSLNVLWSKGTGKVTTFLGGKSDAYSFLDFDMALAKNAPAGTYHVDFLSTEDAKEAEYERLTYLVTNDAESPEDLDYHNLVPTLKGLTVIVGALQGELGDVNADGSVNAGDASELLIYAAKAGSSGSASLTDGSDPEQENTVYDLAEINGDNIVDASDAAVILQYAAANGAGADVSWDDIAPLA